MDKQAQEITDNLKRPCNDSKNNFANLLNNETPDTNVHVNPIPINFLKKQILNATKVKQDEPLSQDDQDKESNRTLREKIAYKISVMMMCELAFIAIILGGIFFVPFINALGPNLEFNLPPFILSTTLFIAIIFILNILGHKNNWSILIKSLLVITAFVVINFYPRIHWQFTIQNIDLSQDIIKLILAVTETIFIKTTILAGIIIQGLFNDAKRKS